MSLLLQKPVYGHSATKINVLTIAALWTKSVGTVMLARCGRASAALIGTTLPKQEPAGATTGYINRTREDTLPLINRLDI